MDQPDPIGVAIFADLENVLGYRLLFNQGGTNMISIFLFELLSAIKKANISLHPKLCYAFMQKRPKMSPGWHRRCTETVERYGFKLHWSEPDQPAEDLIEIYAEDTVRQNNLPPEIFIVSGDGDLIPTVDHLRWNGVRRQVCVISFGRKLNPYFKMVASGVIELNTLTPRTAQLSLN